MKREDHEFFRWRRPSGEIGWHQGGGDLGDGFWVLEDGRRQGEFYTPLDDEPGLFRRFALGTEPTPEKVQQFIREFGTLGLTSGKETLEIWKINIESMQRCIQWWDMLKQGKDVELRGKLRESKADFDRDTQQAFDRGDIDVAALCLINREVNLRLEEHVRPALEFDPRQSRDRLVLIPRNLLGAMWLQLAETVSSGKLHRQCEACGRWFEVSAGNYRTDRKYCSDACKVRAYRARIQDALAMHEAGKSTKEIAAKHKTNEKTVKKWITYGS